MNAMLVRSAAPPLLELQGVSRHYRVRVPHRPWQRARLQALRDVSFQLGVGETLCVVGESGCGKSTLVQMVALLGKPDDGRIVLDGVDVTNAAGAALKAFRRQVQVVFQDPYSSLNPRLTLLQIISEPLRNFTSMTPAQRAARCAQLLERVGLRAGDLQRRPADLSGGQRQRVAIARAFAASPKVVLADEAVSALDVSIKAQVLNLLIELQRDLDLSYIFVTHDIGVVESIADRIMVMYLGRVVEIGTSETVLSRPRHPYTRMLLDAVPRLDRPGRDSGEQPVGEIPSALRPPSGCGFRTRCCHATTRCCEIEPALSSIGLGHQVACHHAGD
jgi:oligopeptide/dipeptide ABC transporter ATP-binding protein